MLVIRREQLEAFIAPDETALVQVVSRAVREANGERLSGYDDKELTTMVKIGIERARSRGLKFAEDIAAFVAIMFEVAPRFDEQAEINAALSDENLTPELRLETLFARANEPAWTEAEKKYEDSFWFPG